MYGCYRLTPFDRDGDLHVAGVLLVVCDLEANLCAHAPGDRQPRVGLRLGLGPLSIWTWRLVARVCAHAPERFPQKGCCVIVVHGVLWAGAESEVYSCPPAPSPQPLALGLVRPELT